MKKIRIFLWVILVGVVGWLLYMGVVPGGKISYEYNFIKPSNFIRKLTPPGRVGLVKGGKQEIIGNPVYFFLRTPRKFDKAVLTLKYRDIDNQNKEFVSRNPSTSIIEGGFLVDKNLWSYNLKPIENKILDQIALSWNKIGEKGVTIFERDKKYNSVEDFLNNPPNINEIASYNYDLNIEYILPKYRPMTEKSEIGYSLRGNYRFYVYIKDEDLDMVFSFEDLNKYLGKDPVDLNLYYKNKLIDSKRMEDDGIISDRGEKNTPPELFLKKSGLPEGIYKIEVNAGNDIVTTKILTMQKSISFINKIWISDTGKSNFSIYTDSRSITAQTINPAKMQKIKSGESELIINKTYSQFSADLSSSTNEIQLEKDDVMLSGDGVFSFNKESLINPETKKVNRNFDANKENVNYILANYNNPREENGWKIKETEFDLSQAYREDGAYSFMISIPGLKSEDKINDGIEINFIKFSLEGKTLTEKLKNIFYEK